jgi:hypothetical protein
MKRFMRVLLVAVLAVTSLAIASPAEATPYCGIRWGSLAKVTPEGSGAQLTGVRTGRHACYDRLVLDISGPVGRYAVWYASSIHNPQTDAQIPLRGGAFLQVTVQASTYDANGVTSVKLSSPSNLANVSSYRTFRQVAWAGDSSTGYTIIALGVRARLPFRVFTLGGPNGGTRLVVDVAHRW